MVLWEFLLRALHSELKVKLNEIKLLTTIEITSRCNCCMLKTFSCWQFQKQHSLPGIMKYSCQSLLNVIYLNWAVEKSREDQCTISPFYMFYAVWRCTFPTLSLTVSIHQCPTEDTIIYWFATLPSFSPVSFSPIIISDSEEKRAL